MPARPPDSAPGLLGDPVVESSSSVVRRAVVRFTGLSLGVLLVLTVGTVLMSHHIARAVALKDAKSHSRAVATGISAMVDAEVRAGDGLSLQAISLALAPSLEDGTISHIKLWARDGTVIWADDEQLVGRRFTLDRDVVELFGTEGPTASVSLLGQAEEHSDEVLEVHVGAIDAEGEPWVFEAYLSTEWMDEDQNAILAGLLVLSVGGILLLQLAVLPLAVSLARRVQRAQEERAKFVRHALLASELERRRIAQFLHDGIIQDLAGLGYALSVVSARLPTGSEGRDARDALQGVSELLDREVPALRTMLGDIYPPDLEEGGIESALEELAVSAADVGVLVDVSISAGFRAQPEATMLAYRVVREGLRNVVAHSRSATAEVHLLRRENDVVVRVVDQGQGLSETSGRTRGHYGLRLLHDAVPDLGGTLDLRNASGGGVILEAVFAADLVRT